MKKEIGFVGLGRMGLNMATRLVDQGYEVIGFDLDDKARQRAEKEGVKTVESYDDLLAKLSPERLLWLMVPSKYVDDVLDSLKDNLSNADTIIDGGNSFYKDSIRRHQELEAMGISFLDVGTSGGVEGARKGASLMVGGKESVFNKYEPVFADLAATNGYARVGKAGAGHFVKMVHNGIEYGMMGAIAEGMALLNEQKDEFAIDLNEVLKPYVHESIITSKLVSWLAEAYEQGQIEQIAGEVPTGETELEMEHITKIGDVPVLEAALLQRKSTRKKPSYVGKLIAAMRNQFGGHKVFNKDR